MADYHHGRPNDIALLGPYSYSDRIRYCWSDPVVVDTVARLIGNLWQAKISETLVLQSLAGLDFGNIPTDPEMLLARHVPLCVQRHSQAAGGV